MCAGAASTCPTAAPTFVRLRRPKWPASRRRAHNSPRPKSCALAANINLRAPQVCRLSKAESRVANRRTNRKRTLARAAVPQTKASARLNHWQHKRLTTGLCRTLAVCVLQIVSTVDFRAAIAAEQRRNNRRTDRLVYLSIWVRGPIVVRVAPHAVVKQHLQLVAR